jgi:Condensation domain
VQRQQAEGREYEYAALVEVQGWSEIPRGQPLFESLLIFQNFPMQNIPDEHRKGMDVYSFRVRTRTGVPLVLTIMPDTRMLLWIQYETGMFEAVKIKRMLRHLQTILDVICSRPEITLNELNEYLDETEKQMWNTEEKDIRKASLRKFSLLRREPVVTDILEG